MKHQIPASEALAKEETEGKSTNVHPSRNLDPRAKGYGIGGGYEKPYRRPLRPADKPNQSYGPVPHSGYYGAGAGAERFERGEAGFRTELQWYGPQYGEKTIGRSKENA